MKKRRSWKMRMISTMRRETTKSINFISFFSDIYVQTCMNVCSWCRRKSENHWKSDRERWNFSFSANLAVALQLFLGKHSREKDENSSTVIRSIPEEMLLALSGWWITFFLWSFGGKLELNNGNRLWAVK